LRSERKWSNVTRTLPLGEGPTHDSALQRAREWLTEALVSDPGLMTLVGGRGGVSVVGRCR